MSKPASITSSKKKSNDANFELEQQFILRMPPEAAGPLREEIVSGSVTLPHNISIEMLSDGRRALIRCGHFIYNAKLVDLPCIIESLKTIDRKTFYKTADICQMLVCTEDDEANMEAVETLKKKERDKKYTWNHGITPPLKNVRRRRFRKTLTKKYNEQPDIEKEVRHLFRMDAEAIDVKWEVIVEETNQGQSPSHESSQIREDGVLSEASQHAGVTTSVAGIDIFGELSSSEEDEKDVNVLDSGEEDGAGVSQISVPFDDDGHRVTSSQKSSRSQDGARISLADCDDPDAVVKEQELLGIKVEGIKADLEGLRSARMEQEIQMATIDNPALKHHFQEMVDKLVEEENDKEMQLQTLLSMMDE